MHTLHGRRGTSLLVVVLLLVSILLEQVIAGYCPWLGELGGVRPMIVFLDIPLETPVTIDWLPVGFLFLLFYGLIGGGHPEEKPTGEIRRRGWTILGRWWLLLLFLLIGGGLFELIHEFLPKTIQNGLDSFGLRADLVLPYPSGEIVHLHGSMIMLALFVPGWRLLVNAALHHALPAPVIAPVPRRLPPPARADPSAPVRERMVMRISEPVECRTSVNHPCVYVSMPRGFEQQRNSYPCVVDGGIRPAGATGKDSSQ